MVPFWASTDSGFVPIRGPHPKPHRPEEAVYILNNSCSHFTQRLFPPRVPQHTHHYFLVYIQYIEYHSCLLYITFIRTFTSLFTCLIDDFISSDHLGRLAAHGFLCPIQWYNHFCIMLYARRAWGFIEVYIDDFAYVPRWFVNVYHGNSFCVPWWFLHKNVVIHACPSWWVLHW